MTHRKAINRKEAGFTLLEMLIVIGIIALLAALATPQLLKYFGRAKADTAQTQLTYIANALDFYFLDVGAFPAKAEGLDSLMNRPVSATTWDGPYLKNETGLIDPWGNAYIYEHNSNGLPVIKSMGADGIPGGDGNNTDLSVSPSTY